MSYTAAERETSVIANDADDFVSIISSQVKYINRLKKNPKATLIREGVDGGSVWAEFHIPADQWSPTGGIKATRAPLSPEQKAALAERLRNMRQQT